MMGESSSPTYVKYTTVAGYFLQDNPNTDPNDFDFVRSPSPPLLGPPPFPESKLNTPQTTTNFGLIPRSYETDALFERIEPDTKSTQWQRFSNHLSRLNAETGNEVQYKVLFRASGPRICDIS